MGRRNAGEYLSSVCEDDLEHSDMNYGCSWKIIKCIAIRKIYLCFIWLFPFFTFSFRVLQNQTLFHHHKKVSAQEKKKKRCHFIQTGWWIALILFLPFPGEMHDIFVGLMGRRNAESGKCQIEILFLFQNCKRCVALYLNGTAVFYSVSSCTDNGPWRREYPERRGVFLNKCRLRWVLPPSIPPHTHTHPLLCIAAQITQPPFWWIFTFSTVKR